MYKRMLILAIIIGALCIPATACGTSAPNTTTDSTSTQQPSVPEMNPDEERLYTYIQENLSYTITKLSVKSKDEGYDIAINVPGTPDMLQDLCAQSVDCIEKYAEENDISIAVINPIIHSNDHTYFGWSTNGTLYSYKTYPVAENVAVSDITSILSASVDMSAYYTPDVEDLLPIADEDIEWEIVSTQEYARDGKKCMGYRIYINTERASFAQYQDIFKEVTDDGKYLHTVWFYFDETSADGSGSADVIMDERIEDSMPIPERQY